MHEDHVEKINKNENYDTNLLITPEKMAIKLWIVKIYSPAACSVTRTPAVYCAL